MEDDNNLIVLTAEIVSSYVSNNAIQGSDIPALVASVHQTLQQVETTSTEPAIPENKPFVSIKASVKPDHLVCLACGAKQKTLKRHLNASHGLTPAEYRLRYNLPSDYPVVAPEYADRRSALARKIGLGRKRGGA